MWATFTDVICRISYRRFGDQKGKQSRNAETNIAFANRKESKAAVRKERAKIESKPLCGKKL
eukprot:686447-Amphidinium_carterae.1